MSFYTFRKRKTKNELDRRKDLSNFEQYCIIIWNDLNGTMIPEELFMRVYNFSAGPSMLPLEVLEEAQKEFLDFAGTGMSVTEISHRDKAFSAIVEEAEANLRELMNIPDNYCVLFVQGGASQQFAAIPLNLMKSGKADYIVTGNFAKKAWQEGKIYGDARLVASSEDKTYTYIPDVDKIAFNEDSD